MADLLTQIEQTLVERLDALASFGLRIVGGTLKGSQDLSGRPTVRGQIVVAYQGSRSEPRQVVTEPIYQEREIRFEAQIQLTDLRSYSACYPILGRVIDHLNGFEPLDAYGRPLTLTPFRHVSDEFLGVDEESRAWVYSASFAARLHFIQASSWQLLDPEISIRLAPPAIALRVG